MQVRTIETYGEGKITSIEDFVGKALEGDLYASRILDSIMTNALWDRMYEMTNAGCKKCRAPHSCCSPEYCEYADNYSQKQGITLQRTDHSTLPFMGSDGCIVPPHLRPTCTIHTCDIASLGFHKSNPDWTDRYWELRYKLSDLEE